MKIAKGIAQVHSYNVVSSLSTMCSFLAYFSLFCCPVGKWTDDVVRVALIAFAATFVESLPISTKLDDNLTVPVTAICVGSVLYSIG